MNEQDTQPEAMRLPPIPPPLPVPEAGFSSDNGELLGLPLGWRETLALLVLTVLADVCLYRTGGGTGGALLMVVSLFALLALKGRLVGAARTVRMGAVILAVAAVLVWSAWWLAVLVAGVSVVLFAVHLWRPEWSLLESLWAAGCSLIHAPPRLLGHLVSCRDASRDAGQKPVPLKIVLIPIAVSALFLCVFAAANPVMSREFANLWKHFVDFLARISEYLNPVRFVFWCGALLVFAALIRPVIRSELIDRLRGLDVRLGSSEINGRDESNFWAACVTLICVNVVFLGYNAMDAVYLYFKATLPAGITWTAYTHSGCGWLTFGLFLSTVALGVIFWDELNFHERSSLLKRLAYFWIALNAILAVGTLRRIDMYIDYSGLTHLLLTGVYGSLLVMVGLAIMAKKVQGNHSAIWLLRCYSVAFAAGLVVLVLTPQGYVCARYNVPRILAEKPHATWPVVLKELSADALPLMVPLLDYRRQDGDLAKEKLVREGMAGILGQHLVRLEQEAQTHSWQQWQASSWWALKHLRPVREKIYATVPAIQWDEARKRLKADYDLSGAP